VSREKLSPQQWARLEFELRKGPLAHGFALTSGEPVPDQHAYRPGCSTSATPPRGVEADASARHGWCCQVPVRQALERDEDAVAEHREA
jgi:hypothetical protein